MHTQTAAYYMLPGLVLYLLDLVCRGLQLSNSTTLIPGREISVHGRNTITVALSWVPDATIKPGQTVYLRFPSLSLESHPFTVAAVQEEAGPGGGHPRRISTLCHIRASRPVKGHAPTFTGSLMERVLSDPSPILVQV